MPKEVEMALRKEAKKKGFGKKRTDKYVYGAMNRMGMMHGNKTAEYMPKRMR